jgi:hypothetical protein
MIGIFYEPPTNIISPVSKSVNKLKKPSEISGIINSRIYFLRESLFFGTAVAKAFT